MANLDVILILIGIFGIPPTIFVVGVIILVRILKTTKAFVRISDKEYQIVNTKLEGKRLKCKVNGKNKSWSVESKPNSLRTKLGLIPFYFCEVGKVTTTDINETKTTNLTEDELQLIEEQSIMKQLLKPDMLGKENLIMLLGAGGIGIVVGIIIAKFLFTGGV